MGQSQPSVKVEVDTQGRESRLTESITAAGGSGGRVVERENRQMHEITV